MNDRGAGRFLTSLLQHAVAVRDNASFALGRWSAAPAASADWRRGLLVVEGGAGVADTLRWCGKSAADAYAWHAVATAGAGGAVPLDVAFAAPIGGGADREWTNMPAAATEFRGVSLHRRKIDLTNATQARLGASVDQTGHTTAKLYLEYSTDNVTFAALGTSEVGVDISSVGDKVSAAWVDLAAGAKADVWLRVVGSGGNGTADPRFGLLYASFR